MTFNEYQELAMRTANTVPHPPRERLANWAIGLVGEAGEAVNTVKKVLYHDHDLDLTEIARELGDVLWYVAVLARELDIDLEYVAVENVEKLRRRYPVGFTAHDSRNRRG